MTTINYSPGCPGCLSGKPLSWQSPDGDKHPVVEHWKSCNSYQGVDKEYPCRCGETHIGGLGFIQFQHHECFHTYGPLVVDKAVPFLAMCGACGMGFSIMYEGNQETT